MSSVLIVRPSSLGDIVHALPVVQDIKQHRADTNVDWVAEEMFADLVRLNRNVRRVIPVSLRRWRRAPFANGTWREIAAFRAALRAERYDVVIDLQEQFKGAVIGLMARGAMHGADRSRTHEPMAALAYRHAHRIEPHQHLIDRSRQLAGKALGYEPVGPPQFGLSAAKTGESAAAIPAGRFHGFHPFDQSGREALAGSALENAAATFTQEGVTIVLPSGNAGEMERGERLAQGIAGVRVDARRGFCRDRVAARERRSRLRRRHGIDPPCRRARYAHDRALHGERQGDVRRRTPRGERRRCRRLRSDSVA